MTEVMHSCVPISTGEKSTDLHVNYQFGLVLGVDEFEQEHSYLRERDERAARTLHGCGTATGLHVTAARKPGSSDVEVEVARGIAVDQHGRPVVIRTPQCAEIGSWIASEVRKAEERGEPSPLAAHQRPSGDVTVYVVVEYDSCLDALVPLPGNPCGSDDDVTAPSRVRDFWKLGFRWEAPSTPQWAGIEELADLLTPIVFTDVSPVVSDEAVLAAHIRAMGTAASPPGALPPLPARPVLPLSTAREALDRLLRIWITEVRPTLTPDLIEPAEEDEAAVLLANITVTADVPFDPADPQITSFMQPDDGGRPYLAPTQLIQELLTMGGAVTTVLAGSPITVPPAALPLVEIASLTEVDVNGARRLVLWSHLPDQLILPANLPVSRNGNAGIVTTSADDPIVGTATLSPPAGNPFADGDFVEVDLDLAALTVRDAAANRDFDLPTWLDRAGVGALGAHGGHLVLRHAMSVRPRPPTIPPVRHLATATGHLFNNEVPAIELWWHVDREAFSDEARVELEGAPITVLAEVERMPTPFEITVTDVVKTRHNVFELLLDPAEWEATFFSRYLRVVIELGGVRLIAGNTDTDLLSWTQELGIRWSDAQADGKLWASWVRMPDVVRR